MDVSVVVPLLIEKIALARRKKGAAALIGAQVCRHTPLPGVPRRAQACPGVPGRAHTRHCLDCPGEPTRPGVEQQQHPLCSARSGPREFSHALTPRELFVPPPRRQILGARQRKIFAQQKRAVAVQQHRFRTIQARRDAHTAPM
eukprot:918174-Prymnesium_polylepis.1